MDGNDFGKGLQNAIIGVAILAFLFGVALTALMIWVFFAKAA